MLGWLLSFDCQHGAVAQKVPGIKVTFAVWFSNRLSQRDTDQLPSNHPRRLLFRLTCRTRGSRAACWQCCAQHCAVLLAGVLGKNHPQGQCVASALPTASCTARFEGYRCRLQGQRAGCLSVVMLFSLEASTCLSANTRKQIFTFRK